MLSSKWLPPFLLLQVLQISICDDDWLSRMRARDEARMRYYELEEKREMISRERRSKETLKEKIAQVCFRATMSKNLATMSNITLPGRGKAGKSPASYVNLQAMLAIAEQCNRLKGAFNDSILLLLIDYKVLLERLREWSTSALRPLTPP